MGQGDLVEHNKVVPTPLMGEDFDIAAFHDQAAKSGSMPMTVLEQVIDDWVVEQQVD